MKSIVLSATAVLAYENNVPIRPTLPGWQLGSETGKIKIRLFYDLLCPDSLASSQAWDSLWTEQIPDKSAFYDEVIDMKVSPFVLPYHLHSYQMTQLFQYFDKHCDAGDFCLQQEYANFSWNFIGELSDTMPESEFKKYWAAQVANEFDLPEDEILDTLTSRSSDDYTRESWKYATSEGASGTPYGFVNGVALENVPLDAAGWKDLVDGLLPSGNATAGVVQEKLNLY
mmetsp:Transcript_19216/g.29454  ORF Transcript_19216/g.29454 Transcript_19216/m.29454 type:complete len:228 (-) Transcript_19216:49-732(-)|eukprot:CAMPEP_0170480446 /NCGR_PEP_ID=MMETSP0208-20121228/1288_1 /TAXON_ID=197538 /ORGANISM="Strombidium inclinatum, Strain S3" /LENGTH=227 /DNA_ID=CAMNT_0010753001 /DNA_START=21 /DNA_END=704 /DNA_ORIENTATION=-